MGNIEIQENISLAPYSTMKIGGRARFFVKATREDDVVEALQFADERGLDVFILGGGSNILIADAGFDGLVIQIGIHSSGFLVSSSGSKTTLDTKLITVGAGADWDALVEYCVENDLAGLECLSGIPGSVGGTPVQNVGAYGQEVAETIVSVRCLERESLNIVELSNVECGFSYRKSIFNSSAIGRYIVLSVTYSLTKDGKPKVAYKDISERFGDRMPTLKEVREMVLSIRRSKSMVIDQDDPNSRSAGSFFKNPIVPLKKFEQIRATNPNVPSFPFNDESVKVPAAWLIENADFPKGFALGNAGISSKHTLAIINRGNATASEIVALKNEIQSKVTERFGIDLQTEPIFVGF